MKLGDVCQIKYGKDHKALLDGTIPVYGSGGIMRYCDKYIHNKQSVLIPRKGTLSNIFYVNQPFWTVDTLFWTDINEEIVLPKYLYYLLLTKNLSSLNVGTAVPSLTADILNDIQITLPSLSIQENIVKVLSSFDDKIELNKQLNDYLTDLSSAIYNEFINRSSGKWGALSDIVDLIKEPISSRTRPELPYLPIDVIPMKRIGIEGFRPYEEARSSLQLFKKDDIVIGAMRVYFHRVILTPCKGMTRNTCFVLRPRNKNLREFALLSCFQNETIEFANLHSKGSTMPYAVWKGSFENCPVFIPNEHDLEVFSIRMSPLIDKIRDIYKENSALINLRNDLLSQLLSGKIDLSKFN